MALVERRTQSRRNLSRRGNVAKRATQPEFAGTVESVVARLLLDHDPTIRKPAVHFAARLAGLIVSSIAVQTQFVQRSFPAITGQVDAIANEFVDRLVENALTESGVPEVKPTEDRQMVRLTPSLVRPDDWAGPVAGPTLLERHYGMARSTLFRWQKRSEAISFRTGGKKHVFPLRQFVDGRPATGISDIVARFSDQKAAWRWLITPNDELGGEAPIDRLTRGDVSRVVEIAPVKADVII